MGSIPNPQDSVRLGLDKAPNACTDCHAEQGPQWAVDAMEAWWPGSTARSKPTSGSGHPAVP